MRSSDRTLRIIGGAGIRNVRDVGTRDRRGEIRARRRFGEVTHGLRKERATVRNANGRCTQRVTLGSLRNAFNTWIGVKRAMRTGEQFLSGCVVFEACFEPRFVRAVLEETTHEIRHARNQFADGAILAQAKIEIDRRALELIAHAVEHLQFECRLWKSALFECCKRCCNRARVVTSKREFHAAFALGRGR